MKTKINFTTISIKFPNLESELNYIKKLNCNTKFEYSFAYKIIRCISYTLT